MKKFCLLLFVMLLFSVSFVFADNDTILDQLDRDGKVTVDGVTYYDTGSSTVGYMGPNDDTDLLDRIVIDKTTNKTYFIDYKSQTISPTNPRLGLNPPVINLGFGLSPPVIPWYYTLDSHWARESVGDFFTLDESRIHITYDEFKNGDFEFRKDDAGNFHLYPKKVNSLDDLGLNSSNLHLTYDDFKNGDYYVFLRDGEICLSSYNNYYSIVTLDYVPDNSSLNSSVADNNLTDVKQVNSSLNSSAVDNPDSQAISTLSKSTGIPIALLLVVLAIVGVGFFKKD